MNEPLQWGAEPLWQQLEPLLPGLSVEVVAHTASTNTALLERARVPAETSTDTDELVQVRRSVESAAFGRRSADVQPCLLVAEHQTSGRGRMGRVWQAAPGASLTFSLSLPLNPPDWSGLSLAVGVALADALEPQPAGGAPRIGLKWPNDLWLVDSPASMGESGAAVPGRKLGGILIETVVAGTARLAVVGVGLNILPQPADAAADSLSNGYACMQELDPATSAPQVLAQVAVPLVQALLAFNRHGFAPFGARFTARDLLHGREITTTQASLPAGLAQGVSSTGALRVQTSAGLREINSGEVSVRLDRGPAAGDTGEPAC